MVGRNIYTVEEDVCLALSLLRRDLIFKGRGMRKLRTKLRGIYGSFIRETAKYGIDGTRRTMRSIESRVYHVRQLFRQGHLYRHLDYNNPLIAERFRLWSLLFGIKKPSMPESNTPVPVQRLIINDEISRSVVRKPDPRRNVIERRIHKNKEMDAKRLLQALTSIQRKRTEIKVQREENMIRQQEIDQAERKWKIELFHRVLGTSREDDEMECAEFLKNMENIVEDDSRLSLIREKKIQDQIENERENWEWERSTFEELMKLYLDKAG